MSADIALPDKFVAGIIAHINDDHRDQMLAIAHGIARQTWAGDAMLHHADKHGIDLLLNGNGRSEIVRVPFDAPLEKTTDFRPAMMGLIVRARGV